MPRAASACTPGRCRIASRGRDAFGHQLEAKLSCVAAARLLGLDYIDIPFARTGKSWDVALADVVDLAGAFPGWVPHSTPTHHRRPASSLWWPMATGPLAKVCQRADLADSWFSRVERRNLTCCQELVYVSNNCFDVFNCHPRWPHLWKSVAPSLRRLYRPHPLQLGERSAASRVALHVELRGDLQLRLSAGYYARAIKTLRTELTREGRAPPTFRIEGLDGFRHEAEADELIFNIFCRLQTRAVGEPPTPRDVEVGARNATPLHLVFRRLVSASVLVMSRTSLAIAAALLSEGSVIFPRCYQTVRRPLPQWRLLPCKDPDPTAKPSMCRRKRVRMDDAEWLRVAMGMLPSNVSRVCEVNTRDGGAAAALLERLPAAKFYGFALGNSINERDRLFATLDAVPELRKRRRVLFFGDILNSVRAKPDFNSCDVMIVTSRYEIRGDVSKAVAADLPNILQRVSANNVLVMHGPGACGGGTKEGEESVEWCASWTEMVARGLVTSAGCSANGPYGHGWCVGRVPTDSACSTREPLFAHNAGAVLGLNLTWERYFTVMPCEDDQLCLFFKNHIFESWVGGIKSRFVGRPEYRMRTFDAAPTLVLPTTWRTARMTHNLAVTRDSDGRYLIVGGQFMRQGMGLCGKHVGNRIPCLHPLPDNNGVWLTRGDTWRFVHGGADQISTRLPVEDLITRSDAAMSTWSGSAKWIFNGTQSGCVERRTRRYAPMARLGACEFDGRLSLVSFKGELRLYSRANPAVHGQRFVQAVSSADGGQSWGPFSFVSIDQYDHAHGDIYFFAVSNNPVHSGSLLALYPLVHKFKGCIAISASSDGLRWSAPTPLTTCAVHGERTIHHPVQGFVLEAGQVSFYIHENVAGTTSDVAANPVLLTFHHYLRLPPPRLVRYSMAAEALRRWTDTALASLK